MLIILFASHNFPIWDFYRKKKISGTFGHFGVWLTFRTENFHEYASKWSEILAHTLILYMESKKNGFRTLRVDRKKTQIPKKLQRIKLKLLSF